MSRFDLIGGIKRDGELIILFPSVSIARHKLTLISKHMRDRCEVVITTRGMYERSKENIPMANN